MSYYALTLGGGGGGGSGTVTSVSWTGGIVSIATATTTPAFTIAGTSGGIVYFDSATTWASSGVLTNNALIKGGGAGGAPSSVTTGTGVLTALGVNTGSAGAFVVNGGALGTPSSGDLSNATSLPVATGISGLGTGVATALAINVGSAGAPVVNGGALGTPSSGTVTNLTGTASININGTVGATTANTGAFTTLSASSTVSGTGFSTYLASPPAIGGTAAAAGTFTTGTFNTSTVHKGATSGTVTITAPAVAGTQSYTLPTGLPALNGYVLSCTTAGVMSWVAQSGAPGGSDRQIQYNNASVFGGSSSLVFNSTNFLKASNSGSFGTFANTHEFYSNNNGGNYALSCTNAAATANNQYGININNTLDSNNASAYFLACFGNGANRAIIYNNGGLANYSANNVNLSDAREKKNVSLAGGYLDKINAIPVKTFLYIDQSDNDLNLGVIAQDVQSVAPELVSESNWGTEENPKMRLSIYQTDLQYALMKSIQELSEKLDAANARISALEAKVV